MSDFFHPMTEQVARKQYRCINCGEAIVVGERYSKQSGVFDCVWYTNKFHPECFQSLVDDGPDFEFMPYSGERPTAKTQ